MEALILQEADLQALRRQAAQAEAALAADLERAYADGRTAEAHIATLEQDLGRHRATGSTVLVSWWAHSDFFLQCVSKLQSWMNCATPTSRLRLVVGFLCGFFEQLCKPHNFVRVQTEHANVVAERARLAVEAGKLPDLQRHLDQTSDRFDTLVCVCVWFFMCILTPFLRLTATERMLVGQTTTNETQARQIAVMEAKLAENKALLETDARNMGALGADNSRLRQIVDEQVLRDFPSE
jgi:hypothetical protein